MENKSQTKAPQLKVAVLIKCEYTTSDLADLANYQEKLNEALEALRCYGSAEATTSFDPVKGAK